MALKGYFVAFMEGLVSYNLYFGFGKCDYSVIIVTDGQGDGKPDERQAHLQKASELFRFRILSFGSQKDIEGKRLDVTDIMTILKKYQPDYDEVWTHSPLGDYQSHPHHQDTAIACALIFEDKVRYNHIGLFGCGDEFSLTHEVYKKKMETTRRPKAKLTPRN